MTYFINDGTQIIADSGTSIGGQDGCNLTLKAQDAGADANPHNGGSIVLTPGAGYGAGAVSGNIILDGNVGIGTTSHEAGLYVKKSINNEWTTIIANVGGDGQGLLVKSSAGSIASTIPLFKVTDYNETMDIFTVTEGGNVGIGISTPQYELDVNGNIKINKTIKLAGPYTGQNLIQFVDANGVGNTWDLYPRPERFQIYNEINSIIPFVILNDGNVGIGTTNPTESLHVVGNIKATGTITPDYVFDKYYDGFSEIKDDYNFMTLQEVEEFIKQNGHLPGVTSYEQTQEQGGILVNKAPYENLEKIEELFLHVIQINKEKQENTKKIVEQQTIIEQQNQKIQNLEQQVEELRQLIENK